MNQNTRNIFHHLLGVLTILLVISCNKDEQVLTVLNVDTGLTIELSQKLSSEGSNTIIKVSTSDQQECKNAQFLTTTNLNTSAPELILSGFTLDGQPCEQGNVNVSTELPIKKLYEIQSFFISLNADARFLGSIHFEQNKAKLEMQNQKGIQSKNNEIVLIDEGFIWGSFSLDATAGKDSTSITAAQDLIGKYCKKDFKPEVGDYTFFKYTKDGITLSSTENTGKFVTFLVKIDPTSTKDLIVKLQKIPKLSAELFTYSNNKYKW